jgi:hypothetical protein
MFTYSDNTNHSEFLLSYCFAFIEILFICRVPSTAPITAPSFDETSGICAICSSGTYLFQSHYNFQCLNILIIIEIFFTGEPIFGYDLIL